MTSRPPSALHDVGATSVGDPSAHSVEYSNGNAATFVGDPQGGVWDGPLAVTPSVVPAMICGLTRLVAVAALAQNGDFFHSWKTTLLME